MKVFAITLFSGLFIIWCCSTFLPFECLKFDWRSGTSIRTFEITDEWQQGDFITYRRIYPHQRCGGQMVFNGKSERAPYSEKDFFHTHICDLCGTTNQILNATWPQYKREWRAQ